MRPNSQPEITIEKGSVIVYRVFDIAEEIDLQLVEKLLRQNLGESRVRLAPKSRNAVIVRNAPIRMSLGETAIIIGKDSQKSEYKADVFATLWDYGAASIALHIPIAAGSTWDSLLNLSYLFGEDSTQHRYIDLLAEQKIKDIIPIIAPSLREANNWNVSEDYIIFFLEKISGITHTNQLVESVNIAGLLLGEPTEQLADRNRESILENVYQYATDDLVIIDWNSALVVEPSGQRDIAEVLEFTLSHLLEVRYYDDLLDKRLSELYDALEESRRTIWRGHFANISRETNTRFIEFSEFMERIDNSLKVVGDFYLAVIFRAAARRFRIPDWQQSITRKMNLLARVSELLQGEINVHRGHLMELIIIFLFLFELISTVVRSNWVK